MTPSEIIDTVLANTQPLQYPRGERLPFYVWPITSIGTDDDGEAERRLRALAERGIPVLHRWTPNNREDRLREGLRLARLQKKLGLEVAVNANACSYSFFNGDPATAHIAADGEPFFDTSFSERRKIGCPFAVAHRYDAVREQITWYLDRYKEAGVDISMIFYDWEIDGPIEWNGAWEACKRCRRCRENISHIDNFLEFQSALRTIRADMERKVLAEPVLARYPNALVGNYAVYPHNGYRYWYDYFEELPADAPYKLDHRAKYRPWFHEFPLTGFSFAMPTVYTWYPTHGWYNFPDSDYRWFYNMLLVATNAGENTPGEIPIISFVHWHTTAAPPDPDSDVKQFSVEKYQELLWHMLLRGHDAFFLWCPVQETGEEVRLVHQVYAAALEYREFLQRGVPVSFHVPKRVAPVVSALRLGDRLLVRRTDFGEEKAPVVLKVDGLQVNVPRVVGACQVLSLRR